MVVLRGRKQKLGIVCLTHLLKLRKVSSQVGGMELLLLWGIEDQESEWARLIGQVRLKQSRVYCEDQSDRRATATSAANGLNRFARERKAEVQVNIDVRGHVLRRPPVSG